MKNQSVHPHADSAPTDASTPEVIARTTGECSDWQAARDRVLLYLRSLNMPPILSLSIALDVLRRAVAECEISPAYHPTKAAMLALHEVLTERNLYPETRTFWDHHKIFCTAELTLPRYETAGILPDTALPSENLPVTPPLNRGRMLPEFIDRKPVRSFIGRLFRRSKTSVRSVSKATPKVPNRMAAGSQPPEVRDEP